MNGVALPRIRVRTRRRKPRGPEWRRQFRWLAWAMTLAVACVFAGLVFTATGMALQAVAHLRELRRWPCDPEARPATVAQAQTDMLLMAGGFGFCVAEIVA